MMCAHHRATLALLRTSLGRRHHGHRVARRTLEQIAGQCPECLQNAQEATSEPRKPRSGTESHPWHSKPAEARFGKDAA